MVKKNEPKKFVIKKEETKPKEKATIKINVKEVDVYKAAEPKVVKESKPRVVEKIDSERIELAKTLVETWNRIGVVVHENSHDKYTLNNMYVILENALKKMLLAHK